MKIVEFKDYDNQTTPLSAYNLNRLQQNLITTKYQMTFSSAVSGGSTITLPCYYQVGQDTLDVYLNSELLKKASTKDSEGHYYEVGNSDTKSNQIKITSDWSIASDDVLNLIVRGTTDSYDQNLSPDKATQLADEISANKEEITALQTENSRLKGITNALPKISGEDTSLTLTNTANAPLSDIILKGNTSQKTTTGKNLIKLYKATNPLVTNGLTFTRLDDNTLKIKGTSVIKCWIEVLYNLKNGTDVQTTPLFNLDVDNNYVFIAKNLSGTKDKDPTIYLQPNKENKTVSALPNTSISFSNSDGIYRGWIYIQANTNFNDYTLQFQLEEGTTPTDFEPYTNGASPNPDYPQDIKVVTGNNTIKISNKNLLNGTHQTTVTVKGITLKHNNDNSFDITGTATSDTTLVLIYNIDQSNLVVGKTYYFYMSEKYDFTNLNVSLITNTPKIKYWIANKAYTIEENQKFNNITLYVPSGVTMNYHNVKFMIVQGSTAIDYVPYKQQVFPISLGSLELCKIGEYKDYIFKENNKWYKHKVIGKIVFDGTRTDWGFGTAGLENMNVANINIPSMLIQNFGLGFCNYFIRGTSKEINTLRFGANDSQLWFYVNATEFTNINDWKPWLSNNNITVYYVLATPIDEEIIDTTLINQLNEISQAVSYDGTTNISQTNANLPFIINAEAFKKIS